MNSPNLSADGARFACVLETCRRFLLSVANAQMPGRLVAKGGASDLVQETLVAGYRNQHQFRGRTLGELRCWLRGILLNELASFRRRYRASSRDVAREVPVGATAEASQPATRASALDELIRVERVQVVAAAVGRLPADAREVLVLRLNQKLSFREIGARLGRTEEAARKSFARALDRLREVARDPG
jgi:RNA polymerase sigma-70 factor (ECF subfamily)